MPRHSPYTLSSLTIRNSNLHLPASGFGLRTADTCVPKVQGPKPGSLHAKVLCTLRVCGRKKTTVCRIFSCQRVSAFAVSGVCGQSVLQRSQPRPSENVVHLRASRCGETAFDGLPGRSPCMGRRLVENTGLEPVTSWLQTRRSPS